MPFREIRTLKDQKSYYVLEAWQHNRFPVRHFVYVFLFNKIVADQAAGGNFSKSGGKNPGSPIMTFGDDGPETLC